MNDIKHYCGMGWYEFHPTAITNINALPSMVFNDVVIKLKEIKSVMNWSKYLPLLDGSYLVKIGNRELWIVVKPTRNKPVIKDFCDAITLEILNKQITEQYEKINLSIKNRIIENIKGCAICQQRGDGEKFWRGKPTLLSSLLEDLITADDLKRIVNQYKCPVCGTLFDSPNNNILLKSEIDIRSDETLQKIKSKVILSDLDDFYEHQINFPYLGLEHRVGREMFDAVKRGHPIEILESIWFRARVLNDDGVVFKKEEMIAPDPKKILVQEGRYNHAGVSYFYLSNTPNTAFGEVKGNWGERICAIQRFKLKKLNGILDFRRDAELDPSDHIYKLALIYNGFLSKDVRRNALQKHDYLIPRFIADAVKRCNFNGMLFTSVVGDGDNLVL